MTKAKRQKKQENLGPIREKKKQKQMRAAAAV